MLSYYIRTTEYSELWRSLLFKRNNAFNQIGAVRDSFWCVRKWYQRCRLSWDLKSRSLSANAYTSSKRRFYLFIYFFLNTTCTNSIFPQLWPTVCWCTHTVRTCSVLRNEYTGQNGSGAYDSRERYCTCRDGLGNERKNK